MPFLLTYNALYSFSWYVGAKIKSPSQILDIDLDKVVHSGFLKPENKVGNIWTLFKEGLNQHWRQNDQLGCAKFWVRNNDFNYSVSVSSTKQEFLRSKKGFFWKTRLFWTQNTTGKVKMFLPFWHWTFWTVPNFKKTSYQSTTQLYSWV